MIKFSLKCHAGHVFEGWFPSGAAYDQQASEGMLVCPACGEGRVTKALMTPSLARSGALQTSSTTEERTAHVKRKMIEAFQKKREYVEGNFENVGAAFPEEARKIHYGEAEERNIYGKAEVTEVAALLEEGVAITPLPEGLANTPDAGRRKRKLN